MALPKLFLAAREGRAEEVRALLAQGADPEERCDAADDYGSFFESVTALMVAAASPRSNAETVAALLTGGADPYVVSAGEVSALWYAAGGGTGYPDSGDLEEGHDLQYWGGGDADRLRLLLDAGLSPNEAPDNGRTAFAEACGVGDPVRAALLVERGASVWPAKVAHHDLGLPKQMQKMLDSIPAMKPESSGFEPFMVPLFMAAEAGNLEIMKLILAQGFPVDFVCRGENALKHAGTTEVAEFLLESGIKNIKGRFGFDSIDEAFENGRPGVALAMIGRISDPIERQKVLNEKLIMCSGVHMNPAALRHLIAEGAEVNRLDTDYGSALHYACWQGDGNGGRETSVTREALTVLLEAGANPNVMSKGIYPLHEAVRGDWGSPTSVRVLLEFGADADLQDEHGWTPIMSAADAGELECIRLLLAAGADPRPAVPIAKRHVKVWQGITSWKPKRLARFFKGFGLDFFNPRTMADHYHQAFDGANESLGLLEKAAKEWSKR